MGNREFVPVRVILDTDVALYRIEGSMPSPDAEWTEGVYPLLDEDFKDLGHASLSKQDDGVQVHGVVNYNTPERFDIDTGTAAYAVVPVIGHGIGMVDLSTRDLIAVRLVRCHDGNRVFVV